MERRLLTSPLLYTVHDQFTKVDMMMMRESKLGTWPS